MTAPWSRLIAIIDFEATALSVDADVIEVGVAIYDRHETIQTWSSLVRPSRIAYGTSKRLRFTKSRAPICKTRQSRTS